MELDHSRQPALHTQRGAEPLASSFTASDTLDPPRAHAQPHGVDVARHHGPSEPRSRPAPQPMPIHGTDTHLHRDHQHFAPENQNPNPNSRQKVKVVHSPDAKHQSMKSQHSTSVQNSTRSVQMVRDAVVDERSSLNKLFVRHRVSENGRILPKWYRKLRVQ